MLDDPKPGAGTLAPLPSLDRVEEAMQAISNHIIRSGMVPGDRLPTERELMERLQVGRSTIREVISKLQTLGAVETRKGSGTYLRRVFSSSAIHMPLTIDTALLRDRLLQTLEVRRGLEAEASVLAARNATDEDLVIIEEKLVEMERVHHIEGTAGRQDLAFHLAVYDATHNPLFRQLLEQMREAFESFWHKPFDRPDFAARSFPFHRELFDAIRNRDSGAAREKTLAILAIVEDDIKDMSK